MQEYKKKKQVSLSTSILTESTSTGASRVVEADL